MSLQNNNLSDLIKQVEQYIPFNEQEQRDKQLLLDCLRTQPRLLYRDSRAVHLSASAWIVNPSRTKVLLAYHNIYHSWTWLGGHADGDPDLLHVALKEAKEESGIHNPRPVAEDIYSLEALTVDGHIKRGVYVSSHIHLNVTYLLEADESEELHIKADENSGVAWFGLEEAVTASSEPWFQTWIIPKLNAKLRGGSM